MTHANALDILTAWIVASRPGDAMSAERDVAAAHVASCVTCWEELRQIGTALGAVTPETAERMATLFGCEMIAAQLYTVAGHEPAVVAQRFPAVAVHLAECRSCRELLVDLEALSEEEAILTRLSWKDSVTRTGERVRELVGDVVFFVRAGLVTSRSWPDGLTMVPIGVGALRGGDRPRSTGEEPAPPHAAPGHRFLIDLDSAYVGVALLIDHHDTDRMRLEVQVLRGDQPISVVLSRVEGHREQVVARQDAAPSKPFVATNMQSGAYRLDIRHRPAPVRRIRLVLERA